MSWFRLLTLYESGWYRPGTHNHLLREQKSLFCKRHNLAWSLVGPGYHNNYQASGDMTFYWKPLGRPLRVPLGRANDGECHHKIKNDLGNYWKS